ncbi:MAG: EAL domain-containing protein [Bilifractor sp.]|jgi:diguanylate cyclase (GGDEF)-like protein
MYQFEKEVRAILEKQTMPFAIYQVVDGNVVTVLVSDGFCDMRKDNREHLVSALDLSMFERVDKQDAGMLAKLGKKFANHEGSYDIVYRSSDENGKMRPVHTVGYWQTMPDGTELAFLYYTDLSKSDELVKQTTERYKNFTNDHFYSDPLTQLPNSNFLHEFGDEKINAIRLHGSQPVFIYYDVIAMQNYNNQYGYDAGNDLLRVIAEVLQNNYPDALITRDYGDYFQVITSSDQYEQTIDQVNKDVIRRATGNTSGLKAGVCILTEADTAISALNHARHVIKTIGFDVNTRVAVYSQEIDDEYYRQRYIVDHLDDALKNNWIRVFYQGIVDSESKKISYGEALARWIDPNQGMISPAAFIPVLSKYHLMYKLDLHMIEDVCREYSERKKLGYVLIPVSVNLSAQDFDHVDMFQKIVEILDRYNVPREKIVIEITEQEIAKANESFHNQLERFINAGFVIWMDDFGSGYSCISGFSRYRCELIKIDQEFMKDLTVANKIIIRSVIQTAEKIGIRTLCEGVETEEQYQFAKDAGADYIQGFYFYRPTSLAMVNYERSIHPEHNPYADIMYDTQEAK